MVKHSICEGICRSQVVHNGNSLHHRQTHRDRKASLSDGVAVERIAALNPEERFQDCTRDINEEIRENKEGHAHED